MIYGRGAIDPPNAGFGLQMQFIKFNVDFSVASLTSLPAARPESATDFPERSPRTLQLSL